MNAAVPTLPRSSQPNESKREEDTSDRALRRPQEGHDTNQVSGQRPAPMRLHPHSLAFLESLTTQSPADPPSPKQEMAEIAEKPLSSEVITMGMIKSVRDDSPTMDLPDPADWPLTFAPLRCHDHRQIGEEVSTSIAEWFHGLPWADGDHQQIGEEVSTSIAEWFYSLPWADGDEDESDILARTTSGAI